MTNETRQIFVGGSGRSGTTVLGQTLAAHPAIVGVDQELRLHIDPGGGQDLIQAVGPNWSPYNADAGIQAFIRLLTDARRVRLWSLPAARWGGRAIAPSRYATLDLEAHFGGRTIDESLKKLVDSISIGVSNSRWTGTRSFSLRPSFFETAGPLDAAPAVRDFFQDLFRGRSRRLHKSPDAWVDHTPFNTLHAAALDRTFPDCTFVLMTRDPIDGSSPRGWCTSDHS